MTTEQQSLWNRIEQFSLDQPGSALPFSRRLARENRWPIERSLRAIAEYKRFMFLGCVAGHPVSPSEDVDQVWHLHLVYSKSYWKVFCGEVLQRPFHHEPTKGGGAESAKFEDWYAKTLASYRLFFGQNPPRNIWPERPVHHELKWVDAGSNWIIPKPRWASAFAWMLAASLFLAAGCSAIGDANVFDWKGPDFLGFFLLFGLITFAAAWFLRTRLIANIRTAPPDTGNLDAYDVAYLAGKGSLVVNAALIGMVDRKLIKVADDGEMSVFWKSDASPPLHPLENALIEGSWPKHLKDVRPRARPLLEQIHQNLQNRGLVYDPRETGAARILPLLLALIVPIVGVIKIIIGINRDRPIGFLVFLTIVAFVLGLILFVRRPFRTETAKELLGQLRAENRSLKRSPRLSGAAMLPMAVALFGLSVLASTPYSKLQRTLIPGSAGGSSSGCSSGCGGSCGGGCGGGCGGCGGD